MLRRILRATFACVFSVGLCSCQNAEHPTEGQADRPFSHPVFERDVAFSGDLHNPIVVAYGSLRPFGRAKALTRDDFVQTFVAACNKALAQHGLPAPVRDLEVEYLLAWARELRRSGVFDARKSRDGDAARLISIL